MHQPTKLSKTDLELRELDLKVQELQLKVSDLERPSYKKLSFWTSLVTVLIAVIGIFGQSIYSSIKNERAELRTEQAKKEMQEALIKKAVAQKDVAVAEAQLAALQKKSDSIKNDLTRLVSAYNDILRLYAYTRSDTPGVNPYPKRAKNAVIESSNNVSDILLNSGEDLLLKNSVLKVYYLPETASKAVSIDSLLKANGVRSNYVSPEYDISKVDYNEIVYYNEPQLSYCKAVQALLQRAGKGKFSIRLSSGANATTDHFKIYVVR